jgi:hypothetical protein
MQITSSSGGYGVGNITVGSNQTPSVGHNFSSDETYTWLVTASEGEKITITTTDDYFSPDMSLIKVYAGDVNNRNSLMATEEGDANYRLVKGITDMSYTVTDLAEAGTFYYKVMATYTDGSQSRWSNTQNVTLFDNGHNFAPGDVDHDGNLTIKDVTDLINYLLDNRVTDVCLICADVNGDSKLKIDDVTDLIGILLSGK